ncbi:MAG: hypothetical protein KME20_11175 [Kaiparowitsia implicata GSE-PSE-MK54-09C]|nr:hypothetical protein [Kaiparowitsia implicata GSE-PSE-MK54-09C]
MATALAVSLHRLAKPRTLEEFHQPKLYRLTQRVRRMTINADAEHLPKSHER